MWRQNGRAEVYAYLPSDEENKKILSKIPPISILSSDYGFSIGRGSWAFVPGQWTTVAIRTRLNTIGNRDGEIEVFINGVSVLKAIGVTIRKDGNTVFRGIHFQTFFGGSSPAWASPQDQSAYFSDISGAIII